MLLVEVLDDGPGVRADQCARIFDGVDSDKPGGMGIGLSLCRAIVEAHGGRLWAQAGPRGHFCLALPVELRLEEPVEAGHAP
jgi:signal transduction histidine kinase